MIKKSFEIETPKSGTIRTYRVEGVTWYSLYDVSSALGYSHSLSVDKAPVGTVMLITAGSSKPTKSGHGKVNRRRDMYVVNGEGLFYLLLNLNNVSFNSLKHDLLFSCGVCLTAVENVLLEYVSCKTTEVKLNEKS